MPEWWESAPLAERSPRPGGNWWDSAPLAAPSPLPEESGDQSFGAHARANLTTDLANMGRGALNTGKAMALGALETGGNLVGLGALRDQWAMATGAPTPTELKRQEGIARLHAAFDPGPASTGERLENVGMAVAPAVVGAIQGTKAIATPGYRIATTGAGTVTQEEMNQAGEAGGGAIASLASMSPAGVVKTLKFAGKGAKLAGNVAHFAAHPGASTTVWVVKKVLGAALDPAVVKLMPSVAQDIFVRAVEAGNPAKAAEALAKAAERNPDLAAAHAKAITEAAHAEAARVGSVQEGPQTVPAMAPVQVPTAPAGKRLTTREAVAQRAAERTTRQQGALAKSQAKAQAASTVVSTPVVEQAVATLENRAQLPVKGNVVMPSVPKNAGRPWVEPMTAADEVRIGIGSKDDPLAVLSAKITKDGVHVQQVTVIPSMRKTGLATSLYKQLGRLMKEKGATKFLRDEMIQPEAADAVAKLRAEALKEAGAKKTPAGKPLTAIERQQRIKELQAAVASDVDIWEAFGIAK